MNCQKHKKIIMFVVLSSFCILFFPRGANAISIFEPFGGKVLSNSVPGIACLDSVGPITIIPFGNSPSGLYVSTPATKKYNYNQLNSGNWILGLYSPIQLPLCTLGQTPIYVYPFILFGTSKLISF